MFNPTRRQFVVTTSTAAAAVAVAGCAGDGDGGDSANGSDVEPGTPEDRVDTYLSDGDAQLYEGNIENFTGDEEALVSVGAGEQSVAFDPPAFRIGTGTTVVWEWTGEGGGHNVVPDGDTDFEDFGSDEIVDEAEHTVESIFEETGVGLYVCTPHQAQGMIGGFIVE